jgi:L-malate glycosyltransferase
MRICLIAEGASIHTQRIANYLAQEGHDVHLLCVKSIPGYNCNISFYHLTDIKSFPIFNHIIHIFEISKLINKIQPDIVDSHYITIYGFIAAHSGFHPIIVTAWGSDLFINPWQNPLWKFTAKYALRHADKIACLFPLSVAKSSLIKLKADLSKVETYLMGVDTDEFKPKVNILESKIKYGFDVTCPLVINTRGLGTVYGIDTFLKAIPIVLNSIPQAKFIILYRSIDKCLVDRLKEQDYISQSVYFIEFKLHSEMPTLLSCADIYVSSSLSDGASNSLFEAMSCELVPVVTDIPANRCWVVDGENGFLCKQQDYRSFAEKILFLLHDKEQRKIYGRKCRKIIQENAEQKTQMANIQRIYLDVLENHSKNK